MPVRLSLLILLCVATLAWDASAQYRRPAQSARRGRVEMTAPPSRVPSSGRRPAQPPAGQQVTSPPGAPPFRAGSTTSAPTPTSGMRTLMMFGDALADVAGRVSPTVVHIYSVTREPGGGTNEETGSGVLINDLSAGRVAVVTNRHVVTGAGLESITITLADGREVQPLDKSEDPETDLAVLRLGVAGLNGAIWGDSDKLRIGHFVVAVGSPFGLEQSITLGIVSAKGRRALDLDERETVINQDFIQTDAAINPGNSGGPLFACDGRLVGINTAIASRSGGNDGIGFSIPASLVQYVSDQLLRYGRVRRGYLGVELNRSFTSDVARRLRLSRRIGAHVTGVRPRSPAAIATLTPDDVILSYDGVDVEDERHLIHLVSLTPPDQSVRLEVYRSGRKVPLEVRLVERRVTTAALPEEGPAKVGLTPLPGREL